MVLTADLLADEPRWATERVLGIPGRCRGDALGPWGENLTRRFGSDAISRVRRRLPPALAAIAPVLTARDWVPAFAQVLVTEAIVDQELAGDMRALYPLLVEDTRASLSRVHRVLARSLGPRRALEHGPRAFAKVYELGTSAVAIDGRRARLAFRGSPLFAHPTWRLLQLYATQLVLELAGSPGAAVGEDGGDDTFIAVATW